MFVGNTTLIRTVNDTLSTSSKRLSTFYPTNNEYLSYTPITDESNHYDEIDFEQKNEQVKIIETNSL